MASKDTFPAQVIMMVGVALEELQRSEAETDLGRVRNLITSVQSTLTELHELATEANAEAPKPG